MGTCQERHQILFDNMTGFIVLFIIYYLNPTGTGVLHDKPF